VDDAAYFDGLFSGTAVMAILRGMQRDRTLESARRAWELGISAVEVPVQTPEAAEVLGEVVAAGRRAGREVGAGTVTTLDRVGTARRLGCAFTVAPGVDPEAAAASRAAGMAHLPGVGSATDIQQAMRCGCTWVKVFPAAALGARWLSAMRGPFPALRIVATGGIDAHNAAEFLDAGADVVAVGSALADPTQIPALARLNER